MRRRPFELLCWLLLGPWIGEPRLALPSQAIGPVPASRILHSLSQPKQQQPKQLQQVAQQLQQQQQQQQQLQQQLRAAGAEPLSWLLAERGPFHHAPEYSYFTDCYRQGFTTRYRIHREFARWRVNNVAIGRQEGLGGHLGLAPEFLQTLRRLGRRPSPQQLIDGLIRRYGTHVLLSATLGGEEALTVYVDRGKVDKQVENASQTQELLHQLTAAYFIDRDTTVRRLHEMQISTGHINVIETRKGPLGCSSYENLDLVSSVLIQTPENKVQLLGMQSILPAYLRERFVRAALGHVLCDGQGWFECRGASCSCRCHAAFPECNCPEADVRALHDTLRRLRQKWSAAYEAFENSDEFRAFVRRLPSSRFLSRSELYQLWASERDLQLQYGRVRLYAAGVRARAERTARRIYSLSRTCDTNPTVQMPAERPLSVWLERVQSLLYCSGHGAGGGGALAGGAAGPSGGRFSEESGVCVCPAGSPGAAVCQRPLPCRTGPGTRCSACERANATRCGACVAGHALGADGACRPQAARPDDTEMFIDFESDLDLQDLELKYLLQKRDHRLVVPDATFVSNELHLDSWFDPLYRRRMLISLRSNRHRPTSLHVLLGISLHVCHAKTGAGRSGGGGGGGGGGNATGGGGAARGEPLLTVSVNPFGGSHSESWQLPAGRDGYPGWEKVRHPEAGSAAAVPGAFPPPGTVVQCHNWTLSLGNRYKSFFETVHIYMRSRGGLKSGALLNNNRTESGESADTSDSAGKPQQPPPPPPPPPRRGFMKITSVQVFGYRLPFNSELLRSTVLRAAQSQAAVPLSSASSAAAGGGGGGQGQGRQQQQMMLALSELRARVNWLAPASRQPPYDLFGCLLRHRVRLNGTEVARLHRALDAFDSAVLLVPETERTKLCT